MIEKRQLREIRVPHCGQFSSIYLVILQIADAKWNLPVAYFKFCSHHHQTGDKKFIYQYLD